MKDMKLTFQIKKPVTELFNFLLDPNNTPTWIESIVKEETNEWPVKVGTIYRNHGEDGIWSEYTLIHLEPNKSFEMMKNDNNYHVRYTFKELDKLRPLSIMSGWKMRSWIAHSQLTYYKS